MPEGRHADDRRRAVAAAEEIGYPCAIKAQVQIGGRGKAGGIKIAQDADEAREHAESDPRHGHHGPRGEGPFTVHELWIEGGSDIAAEYYASIILDRCAKKVMAMLSAMGGMDVEEIAEEDPDALVRATSTRSRASRRRRPRAELAEGRDRRGRDRDKVAELLVKLYEAFNAGDATLIEVNPLIVTADREVRRARRQGDDRQQRALPPGGARRAATTASVEDPQERMAKEKGLTYVKLDGDIGILGNGAGLCMSTLDVVAQAGGEPANFLDAGGGSKAEAIVDALEVITSDEKVKAVLFNIFGGITRCDEVAKGIIEACSRSRWSCRWSCASTAPTPRRGCGSSPRPTCPTCTRRRRCSTRPSASSSWRRLMASSSTTSTKLAISGLTGREGTFHGLRNRDYGTELVAGVTPGEGRPGRRGRAGLRHDRRGGRRGRAPTPR